MPIDSPRSAAISSDPSSAATLGAEVAGAVPSIDRGTTIGRYVVLDRLGAGGMGVVYAAYDPELDRKVALKVLRGDGDSARARARLVREAQGMARLTHPGVVSVHDVGTFEGRVFVAMEYVAGDTLRSWMNGRRGWREALPILLAVGRGLAAAHAAGLVHRDVKPDNVMIANDGRVLLMDFGLVRALAEPSSIGDGGPVLESTDERVLATRDGAMVGTPGYIAPEVLGGARADAKSDQFAFAVTAWEVLFGERPFQGATVLEVAASTVGGHVERSSGRVVPAWLRTILRRALDSAPDARFATMDALLVELARDRTRTRRRVAVIAGLAVIGLGGWGLVRVNHAAIERTCDDVAARFVARWDRTRSDAVGAAMRATGVGYAEHAAAKVQSVLGDYAANLGTAAREACIAHRLHETRSDDLDARATACLEERAIALEQLVATLAIPDATSVQSAVSSALQLPVVDSCADEQALLRQPPLADAATRELGAPVQAALAKALALELTGHSKEALEIAASARRDAQAIDSPALQATAAYREGYSAERSGDVARAEASLFDAWILAGRIGADELALDVASALARTTALAGGDLARGWQWYAQAEMIAHRLGIADDTLRRARLLQIESVLAGRAGDSERARVADLRALEIYEQTVGPDHVWCASPLGGLARDAAGRGEFDRAIAHHERALALRVAALGPEHPDVGLSHANLGNAHGMRGDFTAAEQHHRTAVEIFVAARGADHPDAAVLRTNLANDLRSLGRIDEAEAELRRAIELMERARGENHPDLALPLFNVGSMLLQRGAHDDALPPVERALAIWETALGAEHPNTARARAVIGEVELARGNLERAGTSLRSAVATLERNAGSVLDLAVARFALARLSWREGDLAAARTLVADVQRAVATLEGAEHTRAELERWKRDVAFTP